MFFIIPPFIFPTVYTVRNRRDFCLKKKKFVIDFCFYLKKILFLLLFEGEKEENEVGGGRGGGGEGTLNENTHPKNQMNCEQYS